MFTKYIDDLTKWIDADKQIVTMEQQELLQDPAANPMNQLSIDENQIEQSALESADPVKNMPNNVSLQQMGL